MMTSQCLIKLYNMSEFPSGIDVNQVMSGIGHLCAPAVLAGLVWGIAKGDAVLAVGNVMKS